MSKKCEKCGAEMEDTAVDCPNCSKVEVKAEAPKKEEVKVEAKKAEVKTEKTSNPSNKKNLFIAIGAIAAVVIILIAILASVLGGGYEAPIKNMFKGMQKADLKTYLKAYPEFMGISDYVDQDDMDEMLESLEKEYGKNIKISYKVLDKEKIEKDNLEKVQKKIENYYDEKVKVTAGYKVEVKSTIKGKDDSETDTSTMKVYKIDGKWYLLSM